MNENESMFHNLEFPEEPILDWSFQKENLLGSEHAEEHAAQSPHFAFLRVALLV